MPTHQEWPVKPTNPKSLIDLLSEIEDYRIGNSIRHNLKDVLLIGLLCIICNGDTYTDMELFGETHEATLRKFLELPHGIPSHDTFGDIFSRLNPQQVSKCFNQWTDALKDEVEQHCIAIDGKTIRRSHNAEMKAKHVVTAFASDIQLILGQLSTDEKSNEITAIPKLLDMFCVKGNIITIDAMGTQTEIAKEIIEKGGDYVLALKENQPTLLDDIRVFMENDVLTQKKSVLKAANQYAKTCEKNHGRIETRECFLISDLSWLEGRERWAGLQGAGLIRSKREMVDGHVSTCDHYVIFSCKQMTAEKLLKIKRGHWAIENQLHWVLDVIFHEDQSRARIENTAEILNILRKLALQLMKQETSSKASMRAKRLRCGYDFSYALKVLRVNGFS